MTKDSEKSSDITAAHDEQPIPDTSGDFEKSGGTSSSANAVAANGVDSDGATSWTLRSGIAAFSLSLLYVGSQIPLYFIGASISFLVKDIGAAGKLSWLPVGYTLAEAVTAPFCGYLQDLMGRRYISLVGCLLLIIGVILVGTGHSFGQAVTGMAFSGAGAGIGELTAISGLAEIVPVDRRGFYLALLTACVIPFSPYVMYTEFFSTYGTWRWGMWICLIVNGTAFVLTTATYFPKNEHISRGSKIEILKRIDFIGGALSIVGLTLFLVALQSAGYTHAWKSAYVLSTLLIGILLIGAFVLWELKGAKYPMVPGEIFAGQRIVALAFLIAFISGVDFYSVLNFFPLTFTNVYKPTPTAIGWKGLGAGLSVPLGASIVNALLSVLKGNNRELLLVSCVIMTVFGGALAAATPDTPNLAIAFGTIAGFGIGGVLVPAATIAIAVTPDAFIATTVALSLSIRVIGGSIGYAIYYNIFVGKLNKKLPLYIAQYAIRAGLPVASAEDFVIEVLTAPKKMADVLGVTPAVIEAATIGSRWAYSDSLAYVWYASIAFGILACIACLFLGNVRPYLTHRVAAHL